MLINHGADINARDNDGKTCLDYVQERIDAGEKDMEIVKNGWQLKNGLCCIMQNKYHKNKTLDRAFDFRGGDEFLSSIHNNKNL